MTTRIQAAHAREVDRAVANERVRDVHTCHDQCTKTQLCRMTRRAEAAEAYIREADGRISELASLLNQSNVDRLREVEALTKGLRVAAIALAHASETDATYRPAYQHVSDLLAGTHIADAGNMVEAMRLRAEAAEADARRYRWLRDEEFHATAARIVQMLPGHMDAVIDAAISGADGEIVPSGCGVEARIHFEDPRYPTLVLDGDEFGTIGYELRRDTGELRRVCICHAHCEHECVCGYDAAIASGG